MAPDYIAVSTALSIHLSFILSFIPSFILSSILLSILSSRRDGLINSPPIHRWVQSRTSI